MMERFSEGSRDHSAQAPVAYLAVPTPVRSWGESYEETSSFCTVVRGYWREEVTCHVCGNGHHVHIWWTHQEIERRDKEAHE